MEFVKIPPHRFNDAIVHLRNTFFVDEPLNKSVELCTADNGHPLSEKYSLKTLSDGFSLMAVTPDEEVDRVHNYTNLRRRTKKKKIQVDGIDIEFYIFLQQIAGVALNGCLHSQDAETSWKTIEALEDDAFKKIFVFLHTHNTQHNLFKEFNVDKIFEVRILSVDAKFRGQGIAKNLLRKCEEIAIENGFRMLKLDATSLFTQKVSASLGYQMRSEYRYDEYVNEKNERVFDVEPPHESCKTMYKLVGDEHITAF